MNQNQRPRPSFALGRPSFTLGEIPDSREPIQAPTPPKKETIEEAILIITVALQNLEYNMKHYLAYDEWPIFQKEIDIIRECIKKVGGKC